MAKGLDVKVVGSSVTIGATTYDFDGPRTLYGLEADIPTVAAAEAAIGGTTYYISTDTGVTYRSDGTNWNTV